MSNQTKGDRVIYRAARYNVAYGSVGMIGTKVTDSGSGSNWYLSDMGRIFGPMSWYDIKGMVDRAQVTLFAQIREETWPQWMPIVYYFRVKTPRDREVEALMPSRYDAMFFLGVSVFIIGVIGFIAQPVMGITLLIVSPIIEWLAIHLESKHKGKTMTGTIGNAIAIVWIVIQILVTIFLMSTLF